MLLLFPGPYCMRLSLLGNRGRPWPRLCCSTPQRALLIHIYFFSYLKLGCPGGITYSFPQPSSLYQPLAEEWGPKPETINTWIHQSWSSSFQATCQHLNSDILSYVININISKKGDFLFLYLPKGNDKLSTDPVVHLGAWL